MIAFRTSGRRSADGRIRRRSSAVFAAAVVLATASGCAFVRGDDPASWDDPPVESSLPSPLARFGAQRLADLSEVAALRLGVGPGLLLHARVTRYFAIGAGALGPQQPWSIGFRVEVHWIGSAGREGGVWTERRAELGFSTFYFAESEGQTLRGNIGRYGAELRSATDLGIECFFGLLGIAIDMSPVECCDLLAGLFGFDPSGDDVTESFSSKESAP